MFNNHQISSFINPFDNDNIHQFNKKEQKHLLKLLKKYYLEYRNILPVSKTFTFGTEIEFISENLSFIDPLMLEAILEYETKVPGFTCTKDASLSIGGLEVQSPILTNSKETWINLEKILNYLQTIGFIDITCSGHIHVGTHVLTDNISIWRNFLLLWSTYEKIIIRFLDGEYLQHRDWAFYNDAPMSKKMWLIYKLSSEQTNNLTDIIDLLSISRYQAVNFHNITNFKELVTKNTIEFRNPNGSLEPIIWQNNLNFILHLLNYCTNPNFDTETIIKRHDTSPNIDNSHHFQYQTIYLEDALELCDLIFDNNLDKIYFLKQYLKDFLQDNSHDLTKAPNFIYKRKKHE